ncbi:hypothetical protein Pmani_017265 [Petrolisthes manimaculis]|uniref:Uncharacterized protein n=1 Tax=Petrolisthes manimaculis TaxID=1843537 RepID=A0AAE1PQ15_9EUCA|nr:hypothetical protein Pmani_017265 [Petrolisthes manimaculis]
MNRVHREGTARHHPPPLELSHPTSLPRPYAFLKLPCRSTCPCRSPLPDIPFSAFRHTPASPLCLATPASLFSPTSSAVSVSLHE